MTLDVHYLDAARLKRTLAAGFTALIAKRQFLNRINVFPVADGDTGNNLAQTARAALVPLARDDHNDVGAVLTEIADATLDGAQGNSGTILAQFFQGLADALVNTKQLSTQDFKRGLIAAAAATRAAVENPREGTIISVIDKVAEAAQQSTTEDFAELLPKLHAKAREALDATTQQLDELRRAGVVDAGASGFVSILEGCTRYLLEGSITEPIEIPVDDLPDVTSHSDDQDLTYRYCTECMLTDTDLDTAELRKLLQPLGNSLVMAGSRRRMRIHIHSNDPEAVFELAGEHGHVEKTKADDMVGQARTLHRDNNRAVAIVTDSAADIPDSVMADLDIHMVPLRVQFGDASHLDKMGMSPDEFRTELKQNPNRPGTSQPTQGDFRRTFEFLTTHFEEVTSINLGNKLSGTLAGAKSAASRLDANEQITVIDSANVSAGQGLLVAYAAQLANDGMREATLHDAIAEARGRIRNFALVTDLSNAVRSGRVAPMLKILANALRITPVLTASTDGKIGAAGYLPGRFRLVQRFAKRVCRDLNPDRHWTVAIARAPEQADNAAVLIEELTKRHADLDVIWQTDIGPALGVHAGMNALVVAIRESDSA